MATNRIQSRGRYLTLNVGSGKKSGDPVMVGFISGVCQNDASAVSPYPATVDTEGVYNLTVDGIDQAGNSAVAVGDKLYFIVANTPPISKVNTGGLQYGLALGTVVSGVHTTVIAVKVGIA